MRIYLSILIILSLMIGKTFELKDGTIMSGEVLDETDTALTIQTKYAKVTINKSDLVVKQYKVTLLSGETFTGQIENQSSDSVTLITSYGQMVFDRESLLDIKEVGSNKDRLPGDSRLGLKVEKDKDFVRGTVKLTDLFFYPIGRTLDRGEFYLSGLSFGFGLSDRLMVTSKFFRFLVGDFNVRLKYKLLESGNIDKGSSLSIGVHPHTRWESSQDSGPFNRNYEWRSGSIDGKYYGGYYGFTDEISIDNYEWYPNTSRLKVESSPATMVEIFTAFTRYKSLPGNRGQISHTLGASALLVSPEKDLKIIPKAYYGLDMDITPKLKSIFIASYDPTYIEPFQRQDLDDERDREACRDYQLCESPVEQYGNPSPFHFDIGFMYALTPTFRIGIHFQNPWIGFYWKL